MASGDSLIFKAPRPDTEPRTRGFLRRFSQNVLYRAVKRVQATFPVTLNSLSLYLPE